MYVRSYSRQVTDRLALLYIPSAAYVFGILAFSQVAWITPVYLIIAYITLFLTLISVTRFWQDWANPLFLILSIGFIRFGISASLLSLGVEPDTLIFQNLGLEDDDWFFGHLLALMGHLGVVIGWLFPVTFPRTRFHWIFTRLKMHSPAGVLYASGLGMLIGFLALVTFVAANASVLEVIRTGEFRGTKIQVGTGKYFYLSLLLIASSVVFSAYLVRAKRAWWIALMPAVIATVAFWILGGRARSLTPLASGLILLWYRRSTLKISMKTVTAGVLSIPLLIVFLFAGQSYRGGLGIEGTMEKLSIPALVEYVQWSVWVDLGHLHSLAGAVAVGPALLGGQTFSNLLWPLSKVLNLPAKSAGVFIVETLVGFGSSENTWGFHATLIGDAYLNFGMIGVFFITVIFGMILKIFYAEFRRGTIDCVYYALAMSYSIRVFFESIEKYGEGLIVLVFAFCVIKLGQTLFNISSNRGRPNLTIGISAGQYRY